MTSNGDVSAGRSNVEKSHTILIVDDTVENLHILTGLLKDSYNVKAAKSGEQALKVAFADPPDLVLLDVMMPGMDGYETTRAIRKMEGYKNLPIVAMTANDMAGDREKRIEAGMNDHVSKPIDPDELFRALDRWIADRSGLGVSFRKEALTTDGDVPIPDLPGIDTVGGVARVGGKRYLYHSLLVKFYQRYGDTIENIRTALDTGNREEAHLVSHTLKGVAGNIGAYELHRAASELDSAVAKGDTETLPAMLDRCAAVLAETMAVLAPLVAEATPATPSHEGIASSDDELRDLLLKMKSLLEDDDTSAKQLLDQIRSALGSRSSKEAHAIETEMGNYKFEAALEALKRLADELHLPLNGTVGQ